MDKKVFKKFRMNDVVQSTVIFADAFNLHIEKWRPANTEAHPHRILLYSTYGIDKVLVGYIDVTVKDIGRYQYDNSDMPFVLYTPFGPMTGHFSTSEKGFVYDIVGRNGEFEKIHGLFKVKKSVLDAGEKFDISSSMNVDFGDSDSVHFSLNNAASGYMLELVKRANKKEETVQLHFGSCKLTLEHFDYPSFNQRCVFGKVVADISADFVSLKKMVPVTFDFQDMEPYRICQPVDEMFNFMPYYKQLRELDCEAIGKELATHDPRLHEFIESIRNALTFKANGITPVTIYDRHAQLAFYDKYDALLYFSKAHKAKAALGGNPILLNMRKPKKDNQ